MSFSARCEEYFGTKDFYEILQIEKTATTVQVKKAYHKASLTVHPDRVPEEEKLVATEKFKIISKIYSVLSDENNRGIYDESGSFEDDEMEDRLTDWINLFNALFKPITVQAIDKHKETYLNSESELRDIKKAYEYTKGNMTRMHDHIPFLDCANEERIIAIVRKMVDDGEVEEHAGFFNEPKSRRQRRLKREKDNEMTPEEQKKFMDDWERENAARESRFQSFMSDLEAKYSKPGKKKAIKGATSSKGKSKSVAAGRVGKRARK